MVMVRNRLYSEKDYKGQWIDAPDECCPCRPCWHLYHFPWWDSSGKMHSHFNCVTKYNSGCPFPKPRPLHIFYLSEKFKKRKKGDVFRCLRCGKKVKLGEEECDWIAVPHRQRKKIIEYLRQKGIRA